VDPKQRATDSAGTSDTADPGHDLASVRYTCHASSEEFLASLEDRESLTHEFGTLEETLDIERDVELVESLRRSVQEAAEGTHLPLPDGF